MVTNKDLLDAARQHEHGFQQQWFHRFATASGKLAGKPVAFIAAASLIVVWAATGPLFNYSDTWQLVINTGTTIITFLMVFLIQHSQNRDTAALQVKLSELIIAVKGASSCAVGTTCCRIGSRGSFGSISEAKYGVMSTRNKFFARRASFSGRP